MSTSAVYVDFSKIQLSKAERKLLREVCEKPQRQKSDDRAEEAERLSALGLVEVFENRENGRQGLFATGLGKAYLEYAARARRARRVDLLKWCLPLVLSIAALSFAIHANMAAGAGTGRTAGVTSAQPSQQQTTVPALSTPAAASVQQTPAPAQTPGAAQGNASGEPSGQPSGQP